MSRLGKLWGTSMAAAVAVTFATMHSPALADNRDIVTCLGANSCKGKSECKMTTNTCKVISEKGQNACKGQGLLKVSKAECRKLGGHGVTYSVPSNAVGSLPIPSTDTAPNTNDPANPAAADPSSTQKVDVITD